MGPAHVSPAPRGRGVPSSKAAHDALGIFTPHGMMTDTAIVPDQLADAANDKAHDDYHNTLLYESHVEQVKFDQACSAFSNKRIVEHSSNIFPDHNLETRNLSSRDESEGEDMMKISSSCFDKI